MGPFGSVPEANEWGAQNEDFDGPNWHTEVVDPAAPLEVRAPDNVAALVDDLAGRAEFRGRLSYAEGAAFHLLMPSDPLHLVGPFEDDRTAFSGVV